MQNLKIAAISLGCSKNRVDTELILGKLNNAEQTDDLSVADVIIINTCGFIEDAKSEAIENILEKSPECTLALSDKFAANDKVIENALMEKGKQIKLIQRVRGEDDIAVAAASVVARAEYVLKMKSMSNFYKINFPKGASDRVLECAKLYIQKYTKEKLNEVAKLHFKTTAQL